MNEPHDVDINKWAATVQLVVTAIRGAGATTQISKTSLGISGAPRQTLMHFKFSCQETITPQLAPSFPMDLGQLCLTSLTQMARPQTLSLTCTNT
jgi:hypothetical protein